MCVSFLLHHIAQRKRKIAFCLLLRSVSLSPSFSAVQNQSPLPAAVRPRPLRPSDRPSNTLSLIYSLSPRDTLRLVSSLLWQGGVLSPPYIYLSPSLSLSALSLTSRQYSWPCLQPKQGQVHTPVPMPLHRTLCVLLWAGFVSQSSQYHQWAMTL